MIIEEGALLVLSTGIYSDYHFSIVAKAKTQFDTDDLVRRFVAEHPDQTRRFGFSHDKFVGWLLRENLVDMMEADEMHTNSEGFDGCIKIEVRKPSERDDALSW